MTSFRVTVLARIKGKEELRDVPIVVLSTSWQHEDRERSLALGARRYVVKPHNFESLVEAAAAISAEFLPQTVT
jgi:CheY-like chemotaxis protein